MLGKLLFKILSLFRISSIKIRSLFKVFIESLTGKEQDFTKCSIKRAIFILSIPMILEMVMESIFSIVDIYFVSKIGSEAVALVGITESIMTIVYAIGMGINMAATAVISRRIGEQNKEKASLSAFQAIILGTFVSLIISILGFIFSKEMLSGMGLSARTINEYSSYTTIMFSTNIVIMLLFIINAIFRSAGNPSLSMRVVFIANIINIILCPCFIFGYGFFPELGVKGAAIATVIGRGLGVIYQLYILFFGHGKIKLGIKDFKIDIPILKTISRIALGGTGQIIIATASWVGLVKIIAEFGNDVIAGYTIAIRIILFVLLPAVGIANTASTLVGQNLGAGFPKRAEKSAWGCSIINMAFLGFLSILLIFFAENLIGIFSKENSIILAGAECLRIISYGFVFYGLSMVMISSINGAGDTISPTIINLICFWIIEIPLAYLLAISLNLKEQGVFYSIVIAETIIAIMSTLYFIKGKWKTIILN